MALRFSGFYGQVVLDLWIWRGATKIHPQTMEEGSATTIILQVTLPKRDGNTRPPDLPLEKPVCRSGNKLELDTEQQTGSK